MAKQVTEKNMDIITLENASEIAISELNRFLKNNKIKYSKIEYSEDGTFYLECSKTDPKEENLTIRFVIDYDRRNPKVPKNLKEYHEQGGTNSLVEKLKRKNPDAWECEVFSKINTSQKLKYGINLNESDFSQGEILKLFKNYLL